jgi:hypothetical protein
MWRLSRYRDGLFDEAIFVMLFNIANQSGQVNNLSELFER